MPYLSLRARNSFLRVFQDLIDRLKACDETELQTSLRLGRTRARVPTPALPLRLTLGDDDVYHLDLMAELVIGAKGEFERSGDYLLFDPERAAQEIAGFLRLQPGQSLKVGREDPLQSAVMQYPETVAARHLSLELTAKGLSFKKRGSAPTACVAILRDLDQFRHQIEMRRGTMERLASLLGAPILAPARPEALSLLEHGIEAVAEEPYRPRASDGRPGALLELPPGPAPILIGDLHGRIDNLLVILTQNRFLEALSEGRAMLIFLGDAVHPDEPGKEDEMDSSMLLMDLILKLKLLFPQQVFYLRGNHDSFSEEISKNGVPQGLVWSKALRDRRGRRYHEAMQRFYASLPHIAVSADFLACHAGPPTINTSRDDLINLHDHPRLQHQLENQRLRRSQKPGGYHRKDVERFRKRLGANPGAPFIVGHSVLSEDRTYWLDAGGIENHHVLLGCHAEWAGVFTRLGGKMAPLSYPVEPLLTLYNRLFRAHSRSGSTPSPASTMGAWPQ